MRVKQLIRQEGSIYRVLAVEEENILVIDCVNRTMPVWKTQEELSGYEVCTENAMLEATGMSLPDLGEVNPKLRAEALRRYTIIAGVISVISDDRKRYLAVREAADSNRISRQTVRKYLCLYLVHQDVAALLPEERGHYRKPLTPDQKNFRWAINKFYYTSHKNSLTDAYTFMLKARYCDGNGKLLEKHPSFNQFRYFYSKYKKKQNALISREGMKKYQRDYRPLLGDRIRGFASHVGIGEIDATICDIHLVDDYGNYLGRPILTILSDSYSNGYVYGYSLTLEGGTYSLRNLLLNCLTDKVELCRQFGIFIGKDDWDVTGVLPGTIVSDMGGEYKSDTFAQITELGITLINLPPLRPELKSIVERSFQLIQKSMKPGLFEHGYVDKDYGKRLAKDSRKNAVLTMREYEKCIVYSILYHNNQRILEDYPYTEEMLTAKVAPHPKDIFAWGRKQDGVNLIPVRERDLVMTLLPRVHTRFSRKGLMVFGLRYDSTADSFTEDFLNSTDAVVAYNPDNVNSVFLIRDGNYIEFYLIESRFAGRSFEDIEDFESMRKELVKKAMHDNLQGKIDLSTNLETIVTGKTKNTDVNIKDVRKTRSRERRDLHKDFVMEVEV